MHRLLRGVSAVGWMDTSMVQLPTDALRTTDESSPSPQDNMAPSYDPTTLQPDAGLLQVPWGSILPLVLLATSVVLASAVLSERGGRAQV